MKIAIWVARSLLGILFLAIGLNEFLHFFSVPESSGEGALAVVHTVSTGNVYVTMFASVEVLAGLLLLSGLYVPLALAIVTPVLLKVLVFHIMVEPAVLAIALLDWAVWIFLVWAYRAHFRGLLMIRGTRV